MPKSKRLDLKQIIAHTYDTMVERIDYLYANKDYEAAQSLEDEYFEWINAAHNPNDNIQVASLKSLRKQK